ncbi:hypothetical protein [Streptosporangium carneum]|uniref:Uncharacterized protein n=1 Tax=Streptosporangium carneum TaxID=47481 RepID=A0A9W6MEM2_9ACTN|nr:hypothetical protein [Streptosporangium carneum]GLK11336.1 hypothetical protein GCM10017600_47430 [Streptosporangium carneum]
MGKFNCACGNLMRTSGLIPNPIEWKIISDVDFDCFNGLVDAEDVYSVGRSAFRCEGCGRLWIYWDGFDRPPRCYVPED